MTKAVNHLPLAAGPWRGCQSGRSVAHREGGFRERIHFRASERRSNARRRAVPRGPTGHGDGCDRAARRERDLRSREVAGAGYARSRGAEHGPECRLHGSLRRLLRDPLGVAVRFLGSGLGSEASRGGLPDAPAARAIALARSVGLPGGAPMGLAGARAVTTFATKRLLLS